MPSRSNSYTFLKLQELNLIVKCIDCTHIAQFPFTPNQYPFLTTLHLDGVELTKTNLLTVQYLTLRNYPRMPLH